MKALARSNSSGSSKVWFQVSFVLPSIGFQQDFGGKGVRLVRMAEDDTIRRNGLEVIGVRIDRPVRAAHVHFKNASGLEIKLVNDAAETLRPPPLGEDFRVRECVVDLLQACGENTGVRKSQRLAHIAFAVSGCSAIWLAPQRSMSFLTSTVAPYGRPGQSLAISRASDSLSTSRMK